MESKAIKILFVFRTVANVHVIIYDSIFSKTTPHSTSFSMIKLKSVMYTYRRERGLKKAALKGYDCSSLITFTFIISVTLICPFL